MSAGSAVTASAAAISLQAVSVISMANKAIRVENLILIVLFLHIHRSPFDLLISDGGFLHHGFSASPGIHLRPPLLVISIAEMHQVALSAC